MRAVIIGLGGPSRGDDAVAHAVIDQLSLMPRAQGYPLRKAACATAIVDALGAREPVVLVDALVGDLAPGLVLSLGEADLAAQPLLSSHSLSVPDAVALARALDPDAPRVRVVAITIAPPGAPSFGLSTEVLAAVERAALRALDEAEALSE